MIDAINMRIASLPTIEALKSSGLIYEDEAGELHVTEARYEKSTTTADQSN